MCIKDLDNKVTASFTSFRQAQTNLFYCISCLKCMLLASKVIKSDHKNNILASFAKVKPKSLIHTVLKESLTVIKSSLNKLII